MTHVFAIQNGHTTTGVFLARILRQTALLAAGLVLLALRLAGSRLPPRPTHLVMQWNVPVTPAGGAHLNWFEMKTDPEDPNNLIVCGAKRNTQANAYYGIVYVSHDGGRSWKTALEDRASTWVSEQSCAFGPDHTGYFISEAAKVIDGILHFDLGTTRIFVSRDAGETWVQTAQTPWADYSQSVVTVPRSSRQPVLYVFYNNSAPGRGSTLGYFTVSRDGKKVSRRDTVAGMLREDYQGVFPSSSVALTDGSLAVLYNAGMKSSTPNGKIHITIGVAHLTPDGPVTWTTVATPAYSYKKRLCPGSLSNTLAYDEKRDRLYLAYDTLASGHCDTLITSSRDGGRTWSRPRKLLGPKGLNGSKYFPILAVNEDGILGLLWRGEPRYSPDCWYFSTSRDGIRLDSHVLLSPCIRDDSLKEQSSLYLSTLIRRGRGDQPVSVVLLTRRDYLTRIGIVATPDGAFHPLWSTMWDDRDELRTASIRVEQEPRPASRLLVSWPQLMDVTDKITVLYGGEQRLDHVTHSVVLDLSFRNDSSAPIVGPIYLKIGKAESDFGNVRLLNCSPAPALNADYLNSSPSIPHPILAPGQTSAPYPLIFHFMSRKASVRNGYFLLRFKLRIFCPERERVSEGQRNGQEPVFGHPHSCLAKKGGAR